MNKQLELDIIKALLHLLKLNGKSDCETCSNMDAAFGRHLDAIKAELGLNNVWDPREVARVFEQAPVEMTKQERFQDAVRPLIKWMNDNPDMCCPYTIIDVTQTGAVMRDVSMRHTTEDFLKD